MTVSISAVVPLGAVVVWLIKTGGPKVGHANVLLGFHLADSSPAPSNHRTHPERGGDDLSTPPVDRPPGSEDLPRTVRLPPWATAWGTCPGGHPLAIRAWPTSRSRIAYARVLSLPLPLLGTLCLT